MAVDPFDKDRKYKNILTRLEKLEAQLASALRKNVEADSLDEIGSDLGDQVEGRVVAATDLETDAEADSFSGVVMGNATSADGVEMSWGVIDAGVAQVWVDAITNALNAGAGAVTMDADGLHGNNAGVLTFDLDVDGNILAGSNIGAPATTALSLFAVAQTYNGESVGAGDLLIGDNSANKANILWDISAGRLLFRTGTTVTAYIDTDGTLVADKITIGTAGSIAGWSITATTLQKLTANVGIILDSANAIIKVGDTAGTYIAIDGKNKRLRSSNYVASTSGFNIAADTGDAEFNALTANKGGTIAGWSIVTTVIQKLTGAIGIILDSAAALIKVGDTSGTYIQIDGTNKRIRSSNFLTNFTGFNIDAASGDSEFNNVKVRGALKSSVFEKDTISAVGGTLAILNADVLATDMTALDASTLTVSGETTFVVNEILRIKDGVDDEWMQISNVASAPTYTVTRDKAAQYAANNNPAWKKGQAVVSYGVSGGGGVLIGSGSDPYISLFTHAGSPWAAGGLQQQAYMTKDRITLTNADILEIDFLASIGVPSNSITQINVVAVNGSKIYVGGTFTKIGGIDARSVAVYNISTGLWSSLGIGIPGAVYAFAFIGTDVYIGGNFLDVGGVTAADNIVKWSGSAFSVLGAGLNDIVYALAVSGTDIIAGGAFTDAGSVAAADKIAKWNGSAWSALGAGLNNTVYALAVSGTDIIAGGAFTDAGSVAAADKIAKWNGSAWSALGAGLNDTVFAIAVSGTTIIAGGAFTDAGSVAAADKIASWNGSAWSALGAGLNNDVRAVVISGTSIIAGGLFTDAGSLSGGDYIAKWDGSAWSALGSGLDATCYSIALYGTDIYFGGTFTTCNGRPSNKVAAMLTSLSSVLNYLEITEQALQDSLITGIGSTTPAMQVDSYQFGFVTDSAGTQQTTIAFDGTNLFTLAPTGTTWEYYRSGYKYKITGSKTATLPGAPVTTGTYYIYIESTDGTLTASTTAWTLEDTKVPVATVVWNNGLTPKYWMSDERHTCAISRRYHWEHHFSDGTEVVTAPVLTGYTVNGANDTDNTFAISASVTSDEDLKVTLAALTDPNGTATDYVVFYRTAAAAWSWVASAMPYRYAGTYIYYDAAGTMTEGANNKFYNTYLLLTNIAGAARFAVIHGQAEFSTLATAQAESLGALVKTGLPIIEYVACYQLTWMTLNGYSNKGKARLAATPKQISISALGAAALGTTSHEALTDLQGGAAGDHSHLTAAALAILYPRNNIVFGSQIITSVAGWTQYLDVSQLFNGYWYTPAANAADGDEYNASIMLKADTYTFELLTVTYNNRGKIDLYIDGSLVSSGLDCYSATTVYNVLKTVASIVISTSGYHTIKLKINGKHASSADYMFMMTYFQFKPASY